MFYVSQLHPLLLAVLGKMQNPQLLARGHIFPVDFDATRMNFAVALGTNANRVAVVIGAPVRPFEDAMNVEEVVVVLATEIADLFPQFGNLLP